MIKFSGLLKTGATDAAGPSVRVTQKNIDQVKRTDLRQACIVVAGKIEGAGKLTFTLAGDSYTLVKGKDNCLWPTHQTEETLAAFEKLYNSLAAKADKAQPISDVTVA